MALPVVQADECGNLTGIPLPLRIADDRTTYATDIGAWNVTATIFDGNPWHATERRFLLFLIFEIESEVENEPIFFMNPEDSIVLNVLRAATDLHRFKLDGQIHYDPVGVRFVYKGILVFPYPLEIPGGTRLRLVIENHTDCELNQVDIVNYYTPV